MTQTVNQTTTKLDYSAWLGNLKTRFVQAQLKAAVAVNTELLQFYWELGADILAQQASQRWGSGFLENLSRDLMQEFPDMKGFSVRNLKYIRQWHSFWTANPIGQQAVAQLTAIPWGYNLAILSKCQSHADALYYIERELEKALIDHITHFLLELGAGFAYMGRQVALQVGEREFFLDLLFYHARLHCYVVVELKTVDFEPKFAGKLNFYLKAVDEQLRGEHDAPTIGLLLCKSKDKLVAEYALSDMSKPLGLATYELSHTLPDELQGQLPSIEALVAELKGVGNGK